MTKNNKNISFIKENLRIFAYIIFTDVIFIDFAAKKSQEGRADEIFKGSC